MLILIVAGGPDKGRIYELINDTEVVLGREADKVQLNDPKCSRRHARLFREGDRWYLQDCGSRHGTHRNHERIDGKTRVQPGDYIQVGSTVLVMGQMPTEHAERVALLGEAPVEAAGSAGGTASASIPLPNQTTKPRVGLIVGSALAAAAAVVAINVGLHLISAQQTDQINAQLTAINAQDKDQTSEQNDQLTAFLAQLDQRVAHQTQEQMARDQVLGDILAAVSKEPENLGPQLDAILAKIDALPNPSQKLDALAAAIEQLPDPSAQLAAINQAVQNPPQFPQIPDHTRQLEALAAAIDARPNYTEQLTEIAERSQHNAQTLAKLDTRISDQDRDVRTDTQTVMARIDKTLVGVLDELRDQREQAENLDAITLALTQNHKHIDAIEPVLNDVLTQLKTMQAKQPDQAELLATLSRLEASDDRLALAQLAQDVRRLADAHNQSLETDDLLQRVLAAAEARADADAKLTQIVELLDSQPQQTRRVVESALARLEQATGPNQDAAALADAIDQIRQTVGEEVRAQLQQRDDQTAVALADATGGDNRVIRSNQPIVIVTQGGQPAALAPDTFTHNTHPVATPAASPAHDGLTDTERAYKLAFETGKPVRVGGGQTNPATGRTTEGRLLDPASARAAGIADWRDWYLMDDFAERMRLQRQAMRFLGDQDTTHDTIKLPSHRDPIISASPAEP